MAAGTDPGAPRLGSWRRVGIVAGSLAAIFVAWMLIAQAGVGISFLYVVPILLAAWFFGPRAGLVAGAIAAALFGLGGLIVDEPDLLAGVLIRGAVYCAVGYLVGMLLDQRLRLRAEVAAQRRELSELRAIQDALVPAELPERPALELASCYVPAQEGVAGDFYIVAEAPGAATIVVVGDVVGKGLDAARRASFVRTAFATFAPFTDDPLRLLEMANYSLIEKAGTSQTFVTAACVSYRPEDGAIAWALAGHPPPLLLDAGRPLHGAGPGLPLGIDVELGCGPARSRLRPGEGLLLYTDGLSEARAPGAAAPPAGARRPASDGGQQGDMLGADRIAALLAVLRGASPGDVVRRLRTAAEEFAGGALADDLCMVALRATGEAAPLPAAQPVVARPRSA